MTDEPTPPPPPAPPSDPPPDGPGPGGDGHSPGAGPRLLRRSTDGRVVGGVAAGLGEYLDIDPVLFRVLFATTAFFGGAGVLAYGVAWALVPEQGAQDSPVDRITDELRRHHVPVWLAVTIGVIVGWSALFSWWAPWGFGPVALAAVILAVAFSRRPPGPADGLPASRSAADPTTPDTTQDPGADPTRASTTATMSGWSAEARRRADLARDARRERRQRKVPMRWANLAAFVLLFGTLGAADALWGIPIPLYFWALLGFTLLSLAIGGALRRPTWAITVLAVPAVAGLIAFGGTTASLLDGSGNRFYTPRTSAELHPEYTMAFGQTTLDLTAIGGDLRRDRTVHVVLAGGRVRVILPKALDARIHGEVRAGTIEIDGDDAGATDGWGLSRDIVQDGPSSGRLTLDVEIASGKLDVLHRG